jgi:rhodanese-related sulfurtransferase
MKISYKKIFGIILTSSLLALAFNYFNPAGVPLIREKTELKWAPDSLFLDMDENNNAMPDDKSDGNNSDAADGKITSGDDLKNKKQSDENTSEELEQVEQKEEKSEDTESKETLAFSKPKAITLDQAYTLFNRNELFIDSRDEADYISGHIAKSVNIPFDDFDNHKAKLETISKEKPIVIYCGGTECDLSILLGNLLFSQGYKQVYVFFGGWDDWVNANYPTEYPNEQKNE